MNNYTVYSNGCQVGFIKAGSTKSAEKKARKKYHQDNIAVACNETYEYGGNEKKKFKDSRKRVKDRWLTNYDSENKYR